MICKLWSCEPEIVSDEVAEKELYDIGEVSKQ